MSPIIHDSANALDRKTILNARGTRNVTSFNWIGVLASHLWKVRTARECTEHDPIVIPTSKEFVGGVVELRNGGNLV